MRPHRNKVVPMKQDAQFFLQLGLKYREKSYYDKAVKYFKKSLILNPKGKDAYYYLAESLTEADRMREANQVLKFMLKEWNQEVSDCNFLLANNYMLMEQWELAEEYASRYLAESPFGEYADDAEDILDFLSFELEMPVKIIRSKEEQQLFLRHQEARELLENGEIEEAAKKLEEIVKDHPDFSAAQNNLALAYFYLERLDEALFTTTLLLERDPGNLHALANLAVIYTHKQELEKAVQVLKLLRNIWPIQEEQMFKLAATFGMLGDHEEAYRRFQVLINHQVSGDIIAQHFLAISAFNTGRYKLARKYWKQLVQWIPDEDVPSFYLKLVEDQLAGHVNYGMLPYNYQKLDESFFAQITEHHGLVQRLWNTPYLRSTLIWAFRTGSGETKQRLLQAFIYLPDEETKQVLRQLIDDTTQEDWLRQMAILVLICLGKGEGYTVTWEDQEIELDEPENYPDWLAFLYDVVFRLRLGIQGDQSSMVYQTAIALWVQYLSSGSQLPAKRNSRAWAAAVLYEAVQEATPAITQREMAFIFEAPLSTMQTYLRELRQSISDHED
ncbi:tetratricopeptide repeat protein [Rubeoparvulum massiliense]|uniref:tetratricopeptide repeat protein n=1 Tax=Rubeoparvulum massiliense TaxID=1631346 RepID=UPI0011C8B6B1|nr:tetratricopeptide repeat protein [Rubeoparvulum massiliense]